MKNRVMIVLTAMIAAAICGNRPADAADLSGAGSGDSLYGNITPFKGLTAFREEYGNRAGQTTLGPFALSLMEQYTTEGAVAIENRWAKAGMGDGQYLSLAVKVLESKKEPYFKLRKLLEDCKKAPYSDMCLDGHAAVQEDNFYKALIGELEDGYYATFPGPKLVSDGAFPSERFAKLVCRMVPECGRRSGGHAELSNFKHLIVFFKPAGQAEVDRAIEEDRTARERREGSAARQHSETAKAAATPDANQLLIENNRMLKELEDERQSRPRGLQEKLGSLLYGEDAVREIKRKNKGRENKIRWFY